MIWWVKSLFDVAGALSDAYAAKQAAKTDREKMKWDYRTERLEARTESILAAQSDPVERWVRVALALPFVIYINKLVLWDKVLGLGRTDPLSAELTQILYIVLAGYFVDATVRRFRRSR